MSKTLSQTLNENKMRKGMHILSKNALRAVLRHFSSGACIEPFASYQINFKRFIVAPEDKKESSCIEPKKWIDSLLKAVHILRRTASASYQNLFEPALMKQLLMLAIARIYANSVRNHNHDQYHIFLDCHVGIAITLILAASGNERRRLAKFCLQIALPCKKRTGIYSQKSHGLALPLMLSHISCISADSRSPRTVSVHIIPQQKESHPLRIMGRLLAFNAVLPMMSGHRYLSRLFATQGQDDI